MPLNLFTIAPDAPFLDVLVDQVLAGFPWPEGHENIPRSQWTILVPNRRTARALRECFLARAAEAALLLPRIMPVGDIDDDFFDAGGGPIELPEALSPVARHFSLVSLVEQWMAEYPALPLAKTLARSPSQVQSLARSLATLIDSLEIEQQPLSQLQRFLDLDLASHREAIVSLLGLVHQRLPAQQMAEGLIGANERRDRLIRHTADGLRAARSTGPIIAAGSTGTIPATRTLLKTIAGLPHGAVVLPGLDISASKDCWEAISPQHPQFAMKQLLRDIGVEHGTVTLLGPARGVRGWLGTEMMRPSETTDEWASVLPAAKDIATAAAAGLEMVPCRDTAEEARSISVIMRMALQETTGEIALITPDRVLARRVSACLARWGIVAADSAGEPLLAFGAAQFLNLLIDLVLEPASITALAAILHHPQARFGHSAEEAEQLRSEIDITLLRSPLMMMGLAQVPQLLATLPQAVEKDLRQHAAAVRPSNERWDAFTAACSEMHRMLAPLMSADTAPLAHQLQRLFDVARAAAADDLWLGQEAEELTALCERLTAEGHRLAPLPLAGAASLLRDYLQRAMHHPAHATTPRVSIFGLLEARQLHFDTVILGGLSENIWPGTTDTGPWLNRPLREQLSVKQPEATIGQMAHDLVQTMGAKQLILTWARRDGGKPLNPSRWVLRLETVLSACGVALPTQRGEAWRKMARLLDEPEAEIHIAIPAPRPAVAKRPEKLSMTQADRLIRDPYAVYARDILRLMPLDELGQDESYSLRGQIFHLALAEFFRAHPNEPPADVLAEMLAAGERAFALLPASAAVSNYWRPRFKRVAGWMAEQVEKFYTPGAQFLAEATMATSFPVGGTDFTLSGRADLIRIESNRAASIFDFKTGKVPAKEEKYESFSYQLTIEAALLERDALKGFGNLHVSHLHYVEVKGSVPPGEFMSLKDDVVRKAATHLDGLKRLVAAYRVPEQPYLPRANATPDYKGYYDHLSRYREWIVRSTGS